MILKKLKEINMEEVFKGELTILQQIVEIIKVILASYGLYRLVYG